ncbi:hypothetical protein LSAT2_026777 [Lamellibrachia satsuma]|nr:hypothetical protein LSAT2_026777 [Lamellibrachia satsuma]
MTPMLLAAYPPNCLNCTYSSENNRTECSLCKRGFGVTDDDKTCAACDPHCSACETNGASKCDPDQCKHLFVYNDNAQTCDAYPTNCINCTFSPNNNRTECSQCKIGFGVKDDDKTCAACAPNCTACPRNGASKCDPHKCYNHFVYNSNTQTCVAYPPNCLNCTYSSENNRTECSLCKRGFGVTDDDKTCAACDPHCSACETNGASKCDPDQCKHLFVYNDNAQTCDAYPTNCINCTFSPNNNRTECSQCKSGFGVRDGDKTCAESSSMTTTQKVVSASRRPSTAPADPSRRLSATEWKFGYADLLEEIGVPRFLVQDETDADGDLSTVP